MLFIWMFVAGLIPSVIAKVLMPGYDTGGLFILGIGGAIIGGVLQYAEHQPNGVIAPFVGAVSLLALHAATSRRRPVTVDKVDRDDFRKAA